MVEGEAAFGGVDTVVAGVAVGDEDRADAGFEEFELFGGRGVGADRGNDGNREQETE